jgi:hypothetical protein
LSAYLNCPYPSLFTNIGFLGFFETEVWRAGRSNEHACAGGLKNHVCFCSAPPPCSSSHGEAINCLVFGCNCLVFGWLQ